MKLFYGTGNVSKLRNMRALIEGLPVDLVSPLETGVELPVVEEDGKTPWENARKKAMAYHRATGFPCMGLDSGLYMEGLSENLQPGTHVRRVGEYSMNDEEFIAYYAALAKKAGGRVKARFVNGICVVMDEAHIKTAGGAHVSTDWFWIVGEPHSIRITGFPMDSIAVDPRTGRYWVEVDLENEQNAKGAGLATGIRRFFSELCEENYASNIATEINFEPLDDAQKKADCIVYNGMEG